MGLLRALNKIRGGYPGGWKRYARGYQGDRPPPFVQPHDPDDRRSLIPAEGLREILGEASEDGAETDGTAATDAERETLS